MQLVHWILLAGSVALLLWAIIRWRMSAPSHPEYVARRDIALLSVLLVVGVLGDAVRARYPEGSAGFLTCSAFLFPVALGALSILFRMVSVYRRTHKAVSSAGGSERRPRDRRE